MKCSKVSSEIAHVTKPSHAEVTLFDESR